MKNYINKLTVTVGIPAYNEEANIKKLLLSILSQKEEGFYIKEIIVVSDGSSDKTVEEVTKVKDRRVKLVIGTERRGQNIRQNEIIQTMSSSSDCLLFFEADCLPAGKDFIKQMVSKVPADGLYSAVYGNSIRIPSKKLFENIINYSFSYKKDLFYKSRNRINLYLITSGKLLSKKFLEYFRWDNNFHEDSYCYRKACESNLPLFRAQHADIYQKSVSNFHDFLLQSGKFQKAKAREDKVNNRTYFVQINFRDFIFITIKYFFINPVYLLSYLFLIFVSRLFNIFQPEYTHFWEIYKSSKKLNQAA